MDPFSTQYEPVCGKKAGAFYMQTSPELHMKRLLCAGFPDIFQISRVFRNGESGKIHNPEFTMLEWYRHGFSMEQLMNEVADLLEHIIGPRPVTTMSYHDLFIRHTGLDPLEATHEQLESFCRDRAPSPPPFATATDALQFIMAEHMEPNLPCGEFFFVHSFPATQAVLAVIDPADARVARRFEVYSGGCELGNGWEELGDAGENRARMEEDNTRRSSLGKPQMPVDENFINRLKNGLPPCSGVAVGLDRIIMLAAGLESITPLLSFPWSEC